MERKITVPGEMSLAIGLLLLSFSIPLMVRASFGISTISSLPYALSSIFYEISFGTWNLIFQIGLLILFLAITKKFKTGFFVSFILAAIFGFVLDIFTGVLSGLPTDLWSRLVYYVASYLIMCVAIALMVGSKVPLMIVDSFINDLSTFFHITFRRMKTAFDISCLSLSVTLSMVFLGNLAGVGVGTVIMALLTGSGVHLVNKILGKVIMIKPWSETLSGMAK